MGTRDGPDPFVAREYEGERFDGADLSDVALERCVYTRCSFRGAALSFAVTDGCVFDGCDFRDARLNGSEHRGSAFTGCSFGGASLFSASFEDCKLVGASLEEADLTAITLSSGDLSYANLFEKEDLKGQDLRSIRFVEAGLAGCDLADADLRDADLTRANLSGARLRGADLRGADLDGVDLSALDLRDAKLDVGQAVLLARCHGPGWTWAARGCRTSRPKAFTAGRPAAANIAPVKAFSNILGGWLAWGRRSRANKTLFVLCVSLAASVTGAFAWATLHPDPGNSARYFAFYWVWGLCAIGVLLAMAEYKTSPLRKGRERGHLFILLYIGALLIVTRALNMVLYEV